MSRRTEWFFCLMFIGGLQLEVDGSICGRREKIQMTVMSFEPRNSESTSLPLPHFECYLGAGDGNALVRAKRAYFTRDGASNNPDPSSVTEISADLPTDTVGYTVALVTDDNLAFGAYNCTATIPGKQSTTIMTLFMRENSYVIPRARSFSKIVNVGDRDVTIEMYTVRSDSDYRWRINGSGEIQDYVSQHFTLLQDRAVASSDSGLYECYRHNKRNSNHGQMRLIVRSCTAGKWGPPGCTGICDNCYNGGVCDDVTGRCICPPGFMGENCLTACGSNTFGYSCEFQCASGGDNACSGRQFCLVDPFGCSCSTGFQALECNQICGDGFFGAGCRQTCHCSSGACDRFTGVCQSQVCASDWSGTYCQIPVICPNGYYGNSCTEKCRCINNTACHGKTGSCSGEQCAPGAMLNMSTRKCEECPSGYFGDSCMKECHCEADACAKGTGKCAGCCKRQWVDVSPLRCQQGFIETKRLLTNPNQTPKVSCTIRASSPIWAIIGLSSSVGTIDDVSVDEHDMYESSTNNEGLLEVTHVFSIQRANPGDMFYCQWLDMNKVHVHASINTSYIVSVLPVLTTAPNLAASNQTSITISWTAWDEETDAGDPPVVAYIPYFKRSISETMMNGSVVGINATLEYTIYSLEADTEYEFAVSAVREGEGGEGTRSDSSDIKTPCYEPSVVPTDVMVTLTEGNHLNVSWKISTKDIGCSTFSYRIYYMVEGSSDSPKSVTADGEKSWVIISEDLEPENSYSVQVSLTTDNNRFEGLRSTMSEVITLPAKDNKSPTSPIVYIIPVVVVVLLIAIILPIALYRHKGKNKSPPSSSMAFTNSVINDGDVPYLEGGAATKAEAVHIYEQSGLTEERAPPPPADEYSETTITTPKAKLAVSNRPSCKEKKMDEDFFKMPSGEMYQNVQTSILLANFPLYFKKNRDDIPNEFQRLKRDQQFPWTVGAKEENSKKNRFRKMFAYDHSRVVLGRMPGDDHSDYCNASYILDQHGKKSFIAAQAPNTASVNFFWVMIWQEEISTIVMLTNLIENGKDRCYQYWPNNEGISKRFGSYVVSWAETTRFANFYVKKLQVSLGNEVRTLYQLHYTTWPDMDVPEPNPLMEFVKHVKLRQGDCEAPVLTHCSAGVGRTGTFIAIYCLMEVIKTEKTISIFDFVEKTRENRINMVQREVQYVFIYQCLVDYYLTRHTELASGLLARLDIESERDTLAEEFKLLSAFQDEEALTAYENPQERQKARYPDIAPAMKGRIYLASKASNDDSNFINATVFTSLLKKDAYIATQSPLPDTIEDFWRLVYDWKCSTIVMLNQLDREDETCAKYWPEDGSSQYGNMSVAFTGRKKHPTHIHRQFEISHTNQQEPLTVHQLQLLSWPIGPDFTPIRELKRSITTIEDDPRAITLVHCIDGAGRSGVFVAVEVALEKASITGNVDVFNTVREMRRRNRHVVHTQDDYTLCYSIIKSLLSAHETYQNLGGMPMRE